jgi:hypothetical protein
MKKILLAACAVLALTGMARSEEYKEYATVGGWQINRLADRCVGFAGYKNGTALSFGMDVSGNTWLRVVNSKWKIPAGNYVVKVQIDNEELKDMNFSADEGGTDLVSGFVMDQAAYNYLTKGSALSLTFGKTTYNYTLKDSAGMIAKLLECTGQVTKAANPFASQPSPSAAPVSTPDNPFRKT